MKVLVVEDDEDKLEDIIEFMKSAYGAEDVVTAKSLQSGLEKVLKGSYDLVILDMTMPNFDRTVTDDGGRPHAFAGKEILRQMKRSDVSTPTIIVTHFHRFGAEDDYTTLEQLKRDLERSFVNYIGTIQYRGNVDAWKSELGQMIDRVTRKD